MGGEQEGLLGLWSQPGCSGEHLGTPTHPVSIPLISLHHSPRGGALQKVQTPCADEHLMVPMQTSHDSLPALGNLLTACPHPLNQHLWANWHQDVLKSFRVVLRHMGGLATVWVCSFSRFGETRGTCHKLPGEGVACLPL